MPQNKSLNTSTQHEAQENGRAKQSSNTVLGATPPPVQDEEGVPPSIVLPPGALIVPQPQPGAFSISISGRVNEQEEEDDDEESDEESEDTADPVEHIVVPSAYLVDENNGNIEEQVQRQVSEQLEEKSKKQARKNFLVVGIAALLLSLLGVLLGLGLSGAMNKSEAPRSPDVPLSPDIPLRSRRSSSDSAGGFSWRKLGQSLMGQAENSWFGFCVSLSADGSIMAVGAPGYNGKSGVQAGLVRAFQLRNDKWVQMGQPVEGKFAYGNLGTSVALSADGRIMAVGGVASQQGTGLVEIHRFDDRSGMWVQMGQTLKTEGLGDFFGVSVALSVDGTVVGVGADENDGNGKDAGHTRVFSYDSNNALWVQKGQDLDGENAGDWFGRSIALSADGDILAVGGIYNDGTNGPESGHARVFSFDHENSTWIQMGRDLDGQAAGDSFGRYVALSADGSILAIGADGSDKHGVSSGHVRSFSFNYVTSDWEQLGQDLYGLKPGDEFGTSVALSSDGRILAVGSDDDILYGGDAGYVRAFAYNSSASKWDRIGQELEGAARADLFGYDVALSSNGKVLVVGGRGNDANGLDSGGTYAFELTEAA